MPGELPRAPTSPEPFTLSALLQTLARGAAPPHLAAAPPGPGERVGRFEVVRELGRGGFGVVLEARDALLHRHVALKLVKPGRRAEAGGPDLAEAAAVAQLSHPNIVDLHDVGVSDAGPFLVFERLEGEPLSKRLERGPLPVGEAARIVLEVAKGRLIAKRAGLRGLLVGSVRRMDALILVELRALDPDRDEYLFTLRDQAHGKSEVLPVVDRLALRARQQLVGSAEAATDPAPVARLVTPSLEAYRYYATGRSLEDRSLRGAQDAYRKAIALDPDFALAHFALVVAASREKAPIGELGAAATAAVRAADRAPWREARLIRAWNAIVERRVADARALFREVLDRHPDDKEALTLYAPVAASPEEALAHLERALVADPTYVPAQEQLVWALRDLGRQAELLPLARAWLAQPPAPRRLGAAAYALVLAGDLDGALEAAKREDLVSPGAPTLELVHVARGEYVEAERVARERFARSGTGVRWLAVALSCQGRRREALGVLDAGSTGSSRPAYAALAIAAGDGPSERLRARARMLADAQPSLDWLAALSLALAGDVDEAERYAKPLSREQADPTSSVFSDEVLAVTTFVDALAARARGEPAMGGDLLKDLVASRRLKARLIGAFALGQACAEDGDLECAVAALRQYRTEYSPAVLFQDWMFPRSTLLLAEVVERQGHVDEARGLVEKLLSDWRNADPDLPELARARALCARVQCHPAPPAASPRLGTIGSTTNLHEN